MLVVPRTHTRFAVPIELTRGALLPLAVFAGSLAYMAGRDHGPVAAIVTCFVGGLGGAASLVVHEFGHVVAARRTAGLSPTKIVLFWGGAATIMNGSYRRGGDQAKVALAGPAASLAFAAFVGGAIAMPMPLALRYAAFLLALLNVLIAMLTLVPVRPLDGHNAVVGALWALLGTEQRARRLIARTARGIVALDVAAGALVSFERPVFAPFVVALGVAMLMHDRLGRAAHLADVHRRAR